MKNDVTIESSFHIVLTDVIDITSVSDDVYALLGFKANDFISGRISFPELIHKHDKDIADELFSTEISLNSRTINIRLRHADGRIRCIKGTYSKVDNDGAVTLELLLQDAKSLWRQQDDQTMMANFKAMMDNTDDYIYFKDRNHVFTGASQALVKITKSTQHWTELLGVTDYDVFLEEYADIYYSLEKQVFAGVSVARDVQEALSQEGIKSWVDNRKYPIKNDAGVIVGLFGLARDITEIKLTEDALALNVIELKQAQTTLRVSEGRLKLATASGQIGVWDLNLQTLEFIWDDNMLALYGLHREDFLSTYDAWTARLHPDDKAVTEISLQNAIAGISEFNVEFRVIWPDDEVHYIKGHASVIRDEDGNPIRMIGVNWDNSAHAQIQQQLKMAHAGINKSKNAFFWINSQAKITDANLAACQSLGYSSDELKGQTIKLFDPDFSLDYWPHFWDSIRKSGKLTFESRHRRKDGTFFPVEITANYVQSDSAEYSFAYVQDISERKQAETGLRIAATAFESQEGMLVTDVDGTILRVNHAFTKITGYTAEEVIGNNPRLLKSTYHNADFYVTMWQTIANSGAYEGEIWNRRKDGGIYPEQLTITAVKDDAGNVTNYVGAFTDISVRKATEARIGFLANHDRLTELPNRELFYDRLSQAISQARRKSEGVALLFLDLDGFKPVNDTYGHEAGDIVLKVIAKRLQACIRSMDTVARLGGDEFAVILSSLQAPEDAEIVAQKIIHNVAEAIQLNATTTCMIGVSIGISIFPHNGTEIDMLMSAADGAMYDSKAAGKNTYTLSTLQNQALANVSWINLEEIPRLGVPIIDEQHLKVASMLNVMNDAIKHKEPTERIVQLLNELISFTDYHFKTEERLMKEYAYDAEIDHKTAHEHLLHEATYLKTQFTQGGELMFLQKLKDWFTMHIISSDKPLADFILQEGTK